MDKIKILLRPVYKKFKSILCILQRTIFSCFYDLKIPIKKNINIAENVKFYRGSRVIYYSGVMEVGSNTEICCYSKIILGGGNLKIGKNCLLGEYGIYNVFANLIIGNDVMTADRVSFVTNIHQYVDINTPIKRQPTTNDSIVIGDGTWIGMNATILAGTNIGNNCVVAAHSVVKGDFPNYCVIAGVSGKIIKKYNFNKKMWEKSTNV